MNSYVGKLVGIYTGTQKGAGKSALGQAEMVADHGLAGDAHAGRDARRQVSLIAAEVLRELAAHGVTYSAGELSANLLTENIPLDSLRPGARLRVGAAVLEIVEARKPCGTLTKLDRRLPKMLYRRCGQLARVVEGGAVRAGQEIEVLAEATEGPPARREAD
jgi:MOSC domain-containing protein YiiM